MPRKRRERRDSPEIGVRVLLACEGIDDCFFLDALCRLMGIEDGIIQIEPFGPDGEDDGVDRMPEYLATLELREGFTQLRALAIVRDADTNAASALQSVTALLAGAGFIAPDTHGEVQVRSHQRVERLNLGVFIMPNGVDGGSWEDLYLEAVREESVRTGDSGLNCSDAFVACLDPGHTLANARREKMRLYAWLSSRERPSVRPAQALFWKYVDYQSDPLRSIRAFLTQLAAAAAT